MAIASTPQQTVALSLGTATTVATVTIADAPAGSALVFHWAVTNSSVQTATPSSPNTTWTRYLSTTSAGNDIEEIWVGAVAGGSSGTTVTITTLINQSLSQIRGSIQEWRGTTGTGYAIASLYDGSNAVATSPVMAPVTGKNALVLIFCRCNAGTTLTSGPTGSFTDANVSGSSLTRTAYQVVASASGTYSGAWTFGLAGREMSAGLILYDTAPSLVHAVTQPAASTATTAAMTSVVVDAYTDGLTRDTSFTGTVTATLTGPNGSLGGTVSVAAVAGVATFSNLIPTADGPGFTLTFATTGYTSLTSTSFTVIGAVVAANQAFVTAMGGDAKLFNIHDPRIYANGSLTSISDVIGPISGRAAGITCTGTGVTVSSGKMVIAAASSPDLKSAADSRLVFTDTFGAPRALWDLVIAIASNTGPLAGIAKDPTSTTSYPYSYVKPAGTTWQVAVASDGATPTPTNPPIPNTAGIFTSDSQVAFAGGLVRAMAVGRLAYQTGTLDQGNNINYPWGFLPFMGGKQPRFQHRVTAATAGSCKLAYGRFGSTYGEGQIAWRGQYTGDWGLAQSVAFIAFAKAQFGATVDVVAVPSLAILGNSLVMSTTQQVGGDMQQPTAGSGTTSFPYYMANKTGGRGSLVALGLDVSEVHSFAYGRSGGDLQYVLDTFDVEAALLADGTRTGPVVPMYHDVGNSLAGGGMTQAQYLAGCVALKAKCDALATASGRVVRLVHLLDPDRNSYYNQSWPTVPSGYSANGTDRVAIGTAMLASPSTYGYAVFDLASLAHETIGTFASPSCYSTTYFNITANGAFGGGDSTHQSPLGYQILGEGIKAFLDARSDILWPVFRRGAGTAPFRLGSRRAA